PAIDGRLQNLLAKQIDDFPGLRLMPGTHRVYPYGDIGCHAIGHLTRVTREDLAEVAELENELRRYNFTDLKRRAGLVALADPTLRGTRGQQVVGDDRQVTQSTLAV